MSSVEEYYKNKKLTYHKTWEVKDEQFPEGAVHWILFIIEDDYQSPYYYGMEPDVVKANEQIKWAIATYLKSHNMLE